MATRERVDTIWREVLAIKKRLGELATSTGAAGGGITQLTGDVTASGPGSAAATIANNAVTPAKMDDGAALSVLGRATSSSGDRADIVAASDGQVFRRSGSSVGFGAVNLASTNAVTGTLPLGNLGTRTASIQATIDGGGSAITTGSKLDLRIPVACTITRATLLADQTGSIVVDIWKNSYSNYSSSVPSSSQSITSTTPPTISTGTKSQDATLSGWTNSISANDTLRYTVYSCSAISRAQLDLEVTL